MNKQSWATYLDGRDYLEEVKPFESDMMRDDGVVAVFGYSDDNTEFRGVFDDEFGSFDGRDFWISKNAVYFDKDDIPAGEQVKLLRAVWNGKNAPWEYETDISHSTFKIFDDGDLFCIGIVFDINDV